MILHALLAAAIVTVPRFELSPSPIALSGPARPTAYLEASGRRATFLGREDGSFEAWVYPMKVLHDFELAFELEDYAAPISGRDLATSVEVRPEASTIRYVHSDFTADATWLVPLHEMGGVVLLDVDPSEPLSVLVRFQPDMKLMWPAGLGGQYSYWEPSDRAYVITESTRRHAALVGSPFALDPPEQPAHNLPDAPSEVRIPVTAEIAASGLVPIVIAASDEGLDGARRTYERLLSETESLYRETREHYRELREERTRMDSPDDELDLALEWGKVALDKGFACNPKLGCGLIAGLGPSGRSERPGFGWYFGGDAFINSWAMTAYGDFETVRESLVFLSRRQRADGKMMHELSQGAAYIPWFEAFPYGYYHADTTPLYIIAVADYVEASGDRDFARTIWPSVRKAYEYCLSADENGDGLMDNSLAGLGAVETGALRSDDVLTDVYLAAAWTEATRRVAGLARSRGELELAARAERDHGRARSAANARFLDGSRGRVAFALLKSGVAQPEVTVWPAFGLARGVFERGRPAVSASLDELASSRLAADWGGRMLSSESALYDHASYNNGAVWPFLSGFASLALYRHDRPEAGWHYVRATKELTFLDARGYVPELLSGDRLRPVEAAVPHQLFSTAGLVTPLLRGLVGLGPGRIAPRIPAGWERLRIENVRDRSLFDVEWSRTTDAGATTERLSLAPKEGSALPELEVDFHLPPGAEPFDGTEGWRARTKPNGTVVVSLLGKPGTEKRELWVRYRGGLRLEPLHDRLVVGERSGRLRVLRDWVDGSLYTMRLEGRKGRSYRLRVDAPEEVVAVEGGRPVGGGRELEVSFPGDEGSNEWTVLDLKLMLRSHRE